MPCQNCARIRSAILHGRMAEAAGITVTALREKIGFKTPEPIEVKQEPFTEGMVTADDLNEMVAAGKKASRRK